MINSAKQSISPRKARMDCFVASAPRKKLGLGKAAATIKIVVARLDRAIQYAAASRSISTASAILVPPVKPGDDSGVCFIHQGRPQGRYPARNDREKPLFRLRSSNCL